MVPELPALLMAAFASEALAAAAERHATAVLQKPLNLELLLSLLGSLSEGKGR